MNEPHTCIGVSEDCKNPESYGEICVLCNKCGRFDEKRKCKDCALYQTGACIDYSAVDSDTSCEKFLSAERYEEMVKESNND